MALYGIIVHVIVNMTDHMELKSILILNSVSVRNLCLKD